MSFSSEVKNELCRIRQHECCDLAECYGMLLLSRSFSEKDISLLTEHEETALRFRNLLGRCFGVETRINFGGVKVQNMTVSVKDKSQRELVIQAVRNSSVLNNIIEKECCASAFLRGAFLASGSIADPNKGYHIEFVCNDKPTAKLISRITEMYCSVLPVSERGRTFLAYSKDSTVIEDVLTFMNATGHTLEFMNVKIYKDFRNRTNRERNCDTANINKTVEAAISQRTAIEKLKANGRYNVLPEDLKEAARLREMYTEASLSELAEFSDPPRNKAWINRKLNKLKELAEEI